MEQVSDMVESVKRRLALYPAARSFKTNLIEELNSVLKETLLTHRFPEQKRSVELRLLPDLVGATVGIAATFHNGNRRVTFASAVPEFLDDTNLAQNLYQGAILKFESREYQIQEVRSQTELWLTTPYRAVLGATNDQVSSSTNDWTIKKIWYSPPHGFGSIGAMYPTVGGLGWSTQSASIQEITEEADYQIIGSAIQVDQTGTPEFRAWLPSVHIPPGEDLSISSSTAAEGDTAGLNSGKYYEFAWCYEYGGVYGSLSKPQKLITAGTTGQFANYTITPIALGTGDQVAVDAFDADFRRLPNPLDGFRKVLWWNSNLRSSDGVRLGPPCWRVCMMRGALTSETFDDHVPMVIRDTTSTFTVDQKHQLSTNSHRWISQGGACRRLFVWPRPSSSLLSAGQHDHSGTNVQKKESYYPVQMEFYGSHFDLALETDQPEVPSWVSSYLAGEVAARIVQSTNDSSGADSIRASFRQIINQLKQSMFDHTRINASVRFGGSGSTRNGLRTPYSATFSRP